MFAAIDPGRKGGVAWEDRFKNVHAVAMPVTLGDTIDLFERLSAADSPSKSIVYIEKINGFVPAAGRHQMFELGFACAVPQTILACLKIRTVLVYPKAWQRALSLGSPGARVLVNEETSDDEKRSANANNARRRLEWKNKLKAEAQRRFPGVKVTLQTADALLILDAVRSGRMNLAAEALVRGEPAVSRPPSQRQLRIQKQALRRSQKTSALAAIEHAFDT